MSAQCKNNSLAENFRNVGNAHFRKAKYFDALLQYNQSLCLAEPGSETIALGFANRSAVYLKLHIFDFCLENIKLARFGYPSDKMEKLKQREDECNELMMSHKPNPENDPFNFFKLSYPANKMYPGIVDCLELCNNRKYGNHLVTTKDLKTGDIIGIEDPAFTAPSADARLHRCAYCFKDNLMHLIPCTGCSKGEISEKFFKT